MVDELAKKIINLIQGDLPLAPRPFAVLAEQLGISESTLLAEIKKLKERGIIRRFGATLRHQEAGFSSNAMVVWKVPEDHLEEVGKAIAGFKEVTHCYQRKPQKDWPYNLYSMVHGANHEDCHEIARRLARKVNIDDYILLFSEKEFKKTSMEYF
ncbi:MAG: AsnC family transcriptional regulator [Deltaproteobacteria bacterium]|nr:AsnC family transcriptional regulator [Deltaproteobacteria bacterium]